MEMHHDTTDPEAFSDVSVLLTGDIVGTFRFTGPARYGVLRTVNASGERWLEALHGLYARDVLQCAHFVDRSEIRIERADAIERAA